MPKGPNTKLRIIYLARFLYAKTDEEHGVTIEQMRAHLSSVGISADRKTLYDDIEQLRDVLGMDIIMCKSGSTEYRVPTREFQIPELKLLVDAVCASRFITHKKSVELIDKLGTLASDYSRAELRRQVYVDNRVKSMNESIYISVDTLHTAIDRRKKALFKYFDYNREKKPVERHGGRLYSVNPKGLLFSDGNYYLVAYSDERGSLCNYRVDRMKQVAVSDEDISEKAINTPFDMSDYRKRQFSMFGGDRAELRLLFDNEFANVVVDRFGIDAILTPYDEDRFTVNVSVELSPVFFGWLLQFGGRVRILSPQSACESYAELLKTAVELYK